MLKLLTSPQGTHKMGRRRPVALAPRLSLRQFLRASLPAAPSTSDFTSPAKAVLADVMLNDQLGDCVVAGAYHIAGVETGNASNGAETFHASSTQIKADYHAIGGYVDGDESTDNGCDEETALAYWQNHGLANGTKLLGWLAVDATNVEEIKSAMWLFENLYFGVELPDAWVNPFPSGPGFVWDVAGAADPENGHCFVGTGHDTVGVKINTWAIPGTVTYKAIAKYCSRGVGGQLFVMLTPDQILKGAQKAPNGVAWADLIAAFDSLGGTVPVPTPDPPAPTPAPPAPAPVTGPITLEQAQDAIRAALHHAPALITRTQAVRVVDRALADLWKP